MRETFHVAAPITYSRMAAGLPAFAFRIIIAWRVLTALNRWLSPGTDVAARHSGAPASVWPATDRICREGNADGSPRGTSGSYERRRQRGYGSYGSNGPITRDQAQAIVRSAYQNVLGREPDPASAGYVDRVFNDHWSQQQIENELRTSAE
jgi:hypothetical protein